MTFIELDPKTGELKEVEPPKANPEIIAAYNHWLKRGKWIKTGGLTCECSECNHRTVEDGANYCPNCGVRMEGE